MISLQKEIKNTWTLSQLIIWWLFQFCETLNLDFGVFASMARTSSHIYYHLYWKHDVINKCLESKQSQFYQSKFQANIRACLILLFLITSVESLHLQNVWRCNQMETMARIPSTQWTESWIVFHIRSKNDSIGGQDWGGTCLGNMYNTWNRSHEHLDILFWWL